MRRSQSVRRPFARHAGPDGPCSPNPTSRRKKCLKLPRPEALAPASTASQGPGPARRARCCHRCRGLGGFWWPVALIDERSSGQADPQRAFPSLSAIKRTPATWLVPSMVTARGPPEDFPDLWSRGNADPLRPMLAARVDGRQGFPLRRRCNRPRPPWQSWVSPHEASLAAQSPSAASREARGKVRQALAECGSARAPRRQVLPFKSSKRA